MIESIIIQNFKSIKYLELDLKPINVLIGSNGAGKSNFVNFFNFVYAIYDSQLASYTSKRGGANRILHLGKRISEEILGRLTFPNNSYVFRLTATDQDGFYFSLEADNLKSSAYPNYDPSQRDDYGQGHTESKLRVLTSARAGYVKEYLKSFRVYHFNDTSENAPLKQTPRLGDNRYLRPDGSNLAAFLYKLQQQNRLAFNRIEAVIRSIAPYFDRFDLQPSSDYIRLNWRQKNTDIYLDASDFSDGTLRFIALCTLLGQPEPPKTIIIDEPELGLHPYAISVLADMVRSTGKDTQIILSTQSVNLINEFDPEDIIVVENTNNESIFRRLERDTLDAWLEEYTLSDLWNKNIIGGNP